MKNTINRLKQKPEQVREQIALIAAGIVTVLVIIVWALSLGSRFRADPSTLAENQQSATPEQPFGLLLNTFQDTITNQRQELKENNPFRFDESNDFQEGLGQGGTDQSTSDTTTMNPDFTETNMTTETGTSEGQSSTESVVY